MKHVLCLPICGERLETPIPPVFPPSFKLHCHWYIPSNYLEWDRSGSQFFTCIEFVVQSTYQSSYFICDTFHSYMSYVLYQIRLVIFDRFLFFNHRLGVFIYCFNYAKCILCSIAIIATICNFIILLALSSAYHLSTICFIIIF